MFIAIESPKVLTPLGVKCVSQQQIELLTEFLRHLSHAINMELLTEFPDAEFGMFKSRMSTQHSELDNQYSVPFLANASRSDWTISLINAANVYCGSQPSTLRAFEESPTS